MFVKYYRFLCIFLRCRGDLLYIMFVIIFFVKKTLINVISKGFQGDLILF